MAWPLSGFPPVTCRPRNRPTYGCTPLAGYGHVYGLTDLNGWAFYTCVSLFEEIPALLVEPCIKW